MTELEIYNAVNKTRSVDELKDTLVNCFGDGIMYGTNGEPWNMIEMNLMIDQFAEDFKLERKTKKE